MKPSALMKMAMASLLTLGFATSITYYSKILLNDKYVLDDVSYKKEEYKGNLVSNVLIAKDDYIEEKETSNDEDVIEEVVVPERVVVFEDMTMEELSDKLNSVLSSDLSGKGEVFAKYSLDLGVNPYLAVAISMHETGCTWNCSSLMKTCNNVGGQKGDGCGGYKAYDTLDDGIYGFISNIKENYVDFGLYTAEEMNPKYAEDPEWSAKVNKYIEKIKNS